MILEIINSAFNLNLVFSELAPLHLGDFNSLRADVVELMKSDADLAGNIHLI